MQLKVMLDRFEVDVAEEEGMSQDEFEAIADRLPPEIAELMRQRFAQGENGQQPRVSPQTAGLNRAARPFSTTGTGPQPSERLR